MEHTTQFLKGMFTAYMGCEVKSKLSGRLYSTVGISFDGNCLIQCRINDLVHLYPKDLQPILAPLSEITDEDAVEVARIARCRYQSIESIIVAGKELVTIYLYRSSNVSAIYWVNIIDYLRSKHYDLGYMHIASLITAGLAIKK